MWLLSSTAGRGGSGLELAATSGRARPHPITNPEVIDHSRIGFVDYSLAHCLPSYGPDAGKAIRARLQGLGIMRSSSHQHFKGWPSCSR